VGAPDQGRYPASEVNDRGCPGKPDHLKLTSEERAELALLLKYNRQLRREKDFRLAKAYFANRQLPPRGFA
jgi:hypothetical protein